MKTVRLNEVNKINKLDEKLCEGPAHDYEMCFLP